MELLSDLVLYMVCLSEVFLCTYMAYRFSVPSGRMLKKGKLIGYAVSIFVLAFFLFSSRRFIYFSRTVFIAEIICLSVLLCMMLPELRFAVCSLNIIFLLMVSYLDLSVSFMLMNSRDSVNIKEILFYNSLLRNAGFLLVRAALCGLYFILKKYGTNIHNTVSKYKKILALIDVFGIIGFVYFHYNLVAGNKTLSITNNFFIFFIIITFLLLVCIYSIWQDNKERIGMMNMRSELIETNYNNLIENQKRIKFISHDLKSHLTLLTEYIDDEEYERAKSYIRQISNTVKVGEYRHWTDHKVIDVILNEKIHDAKKKSIEMNIQVKDVLAENVKATDYDLCIILVNLLENAVEACEKIEEQNKWIHVFLTIKGKILIFKVENNYKITPIKKDDKYISCKQDKEAHGLGLESVEDAVQRYQGYLMLEHNEETFTASVTLYL